MSEQRLSRARRDFMRVAVTAAGFASLPWLTPARAGTSAGNKAPSSGGPGHAGGGSARGTKLILLGTKGGPTPSALRAAPANVLLVDGQPYVVDCGNGVAQQLTKAGIRLPTIRDIFITHHHSDHNADLLNLVFLAWASGLQTPVHLYGPPRIAKMVDDFVDMNAIDLDVRTREEGRPPFRPLVNVHEFDAPRTVLENDQVRVSATLVDHYTIKPAFAYRFETRERTVVFSGDTRYDERLASFAKGADVLVHEVMYLPALEKLLKTNDNAPTLLDHLLKSHTTTEQVGRIAAAAGVGTLVLNHFVPGGDPTITDDMWTKDVRRHFKGNIVVGKDLMEI
ncbi:MULTISPECIES: MBL fold metallo-hydrolase [unclassified Xanthomonas]|uniref:MBL fold metallo-hydrolase n=1 Tax=Xanthomonas sp. LMG 9002 TaxID=1591158 RepID=UPI00136B1C88|nr:MBL fold metallo-hydrolase [Xanthomonas sp. LMG 9002]MXV06249.1 MBL fold metallo-hydrolase [Xanthomonas sp. LMG 9002]